MADGPIQPPKTPPTLPNPILQAKPAPEPNAEIVKLPPGLQDTKQPVHVKGEVVRTNNDGTVRIRTDQGDVDVRMDPKEMPREGQDVDVELPAGRPPQAARVTPAEEAPAPRPAETEPPPPRTSETPVDVEVPPPETRPTRPENAQNLEKPVPTKPEQVIRLEQITLQEALELTDSPLKEILDPVLEPTTSKIKIIINEAREVITTALHALLQTEKTVTLPSAIEPQATIIVTPEQKTVVLVAPDFSAPNIKGTVQITIPPQTPISTTPPVTTSSITIPDLSTPSFPVQSNVPVTPDVKISVPGLQTPQQKDIKTALNAPAVEFIGKGEKQNAVTGLVIGHTAKKLPVVAFFSPQAAQALETASFFILQPSGNAIITLNSGDEITLIPQGGAKAVVMPAAALPSLLPLSPFTPGPWPIIDDIYETLVQAMPQAARAFINVTPSAANPGQIPPTALFFIAAVRGGDLTQWLGDRAVDAIRRAGKSGLLSRLNSEGSSLNKLSNDPVSQDWKGINLPLYHDGEMHKLALYYKHESQEQSNDNKSGKQVRFLFDLSLDNMGKVQLDGLFRQKRLDLIVRSESAFSNSMQQQMRRSYVTALEQTHISGELSFQNKPEQWVTIQSERKGFGTSA